MIYLENLRSVVHNECIYISPQDLNIWPSFCIENVVK